MSKKAKALDGVNVLDLCNGATGPLATMYLAAFGARVVWVESTPHPDLIRLSAPYKDGIVDINRSGILSHIDSCKLSLGLNLGKDEGIGILKRLVKWADIVLESYRPSVLEGWGLDYERMKEIKPDIILARSSTYGQTGPRSRAPGWGWLLKGLLAQVHFTGWPDRDGVGLPTAYSDASVPWYIVVAVLAALDHRHRTGKGQYIDISQFETSIHYVPSTYILDYDVNRRNSGRNGNRHQWAAPHGVYPCKGQDRWCAIAVFNDPEWLSFCKVLGYPQWTKETKFSTFLERKNNEDALDALIADRTVIFEAEDLMKRMQDVGVAAGVVQTNQDIIERDPQLRHRRLFWLLERTGLGSCLHMGEPADLSKTPFEITPAPRLGEHTEYVCRELLGMSDEEFGKLLADGVLEIT